jgi:phage terminase large subunit
MLWQTSPVPPEYVVASPDLWNRRQDSGLSGVTVMQTVPGMPPMRMADDRRIAGWRTLRQYLHGEDGFPRLRIFAGCDELIRCMQSIGCDPKRPEDAASQPHALTHTPEALRYGVMSDAANYLQAQREKQDPFRFEVAQSRERW